MGLRGDFLQMSTGSQKLVRAQTVCSVTALTVNVPEKQTRHLCHGSKAHTVYLSVLDAVLFKQLHVLQSCCHLVCTCGTCTDAC